MKNLLFWGGLFLATFWDEMLLAATQPKKTKRQQQFLQTGETAQNFIGAVEDELVNLLKSIFNVKMIPKTDWLFLTPEFRGTEIYNINGGVKKGHMALLVDNNYTNSPYNLYIANGYRSYDDEDVVEKKIFGENGRDVFAGDKGDILYYIWKEYIIEWYRFELYDKVENFEQIEQIAKTDIELAFLLLSGVPNIKKILV